MTRARRNPDITLGKGDKKFEKTRTKQTFAKEANINNIMAKYVKTGLFTHYAKHEPKYADTTGVDFQSALMVVTEVNQMFEDLPAELRKQFDQDPAKFLDWIQDPANAEEAERLGFREPTQYEADNLRTQHGDEVGDVAPPETPREPPGEAVEPA